MRNIDHRYHLPPLPFCQVIKLVVPRHRYCFMELTHCRGRTPTTADSNCCCQRLIQTIKKFCFLLIQLSTNDQPTTDQRLTNNRPLNDQQPPAVHSCRQNIDTPPCLNLIFKTRTTKNNNKQPYPPSIMGIVLIFVAWMTTLTIILFSTTTTVYPQKPYVRPSPLSTIT